MIAWFRSKRQLIADLDVERRIVVAHKKEIEELQSDVDQTWNDGLAAVQIAHRQRDEFRRASQTEYRLRVAAEERLATVVAELKALRDDINAAWTSKPPTAAGVGIARPLSSRIAARPLPADLADEIAQETDMKRRLDGVGD